MMVGVKDACSASAKVKHISHDNEVPWQRAVGYFLLLLPPYLKMAQLDGRKSKVQDLLCVKVT